MGVPAIVRGVARNVTEADSLQMTSLISYKNNQGFHRVILERDETVGVYVFVFETEASATPARDYLQDDMEMATLFCLEDLGVPRNSWEPFEKPAR